MNRSATSAAFDKLTRVRGLVGLVGPIASGSPSPEAISELGWTLEERFDEALADLAAALRAEEAEG
jgi:hypothetical protein